MDVALVRSDVINVGETHLLRHTIANRLPNKTVPQRAGSDCFMTSIPGIVAPSFAASILVFEWSALTEFNATGFCFAFVRNSLITCNGEIESQNFQTFQQIPTTKGHIASTPALRTHFFAMLLHSDQGLSALELHRKITVREMPETQFVRHRFGDQKCSQIIDNQFLWRCSVRTQVRPCSTRSSGTSSSVASRVHYLIPA